MNWLVAVLMFQVKHFVADYLLQTEYMLGKFKSEGWVKPLAAHCLVHSLFTFVIAFIIFCDNTFLTSFSWALGVSLLDFIIHFVADRFKASPRFGGKYKPAPKDMMSKYLDELNHLKIAYKHGIIKQDSFVLKKTRLEDNNFKMLRDNKMFWTLLGVDQMIHHVTHYIIIFLLIGV